MKQKEFITSGEWFDRIANQFGKAVCLLAILLAVVGAVAHLASAMWVNFALDVAVLTVFSVLLANIGKEVQE